MAGNNFFSPNSLRIFKARSDMRNEKGELLDKSPSDLFWRVAEHISSAERTKEEQKKGLKKFFEAMVTCDFLFFLSVSYRSVKNAFS